MTAASDGYTDGAAAPPVWARPDPALAAAGIEGEYVVARVRLFAMALLLIAPTWNIIHDPGDPIHVTGFAVTVAASLAAVGIWLTLRRGRWWPWIGFASSAKRAGRGRCVGVEWEEEGWGSGATVGRAVC